MRLLFPVLACLGSLLACGGGGGGGGSTGGGQTPTDPPGTFPDPPYVAGLLSAAAGASSVRVHWNPPGPGFEAALFRSTSAATVYAGAPAATGLSGTSTTLGGLPGGTTQFFGLALRPTGGGAYTPSGGVLRATPRAPIYVDASASPTGADGASPASAFPTLAQGLAAAAGGGNVWVKDGTYSGALLAVGDDVHVTGGFGAAFTLASRSPLAGGTVIQGPAGAVLFDVRDSLQSAVLDGFRLEGRDSTAIGLDVQNGELELRATSVRAFRDRGVRIRSALIDTELDVLIAGCDVSHNGADGVSLQGPYDLRLHGSSFDANRQEGVDLDDLEALQGDTATLVVEGCRFYGNGTDGLDADFAPPLLVASSAGSFVVDVRASIFDHNGLTGIFLDHDYEGVPGYSSDISLRECVFRANRGPGIQLDADGPGGIFIHRVLSSANGAEGLRISSDSDRDAVFVSASALTGNLGAGVRTLLTNKVVVTSHCVIAGNEGGGIVSAGANSASSSTVFYLQPAPLANTRSWFDVVVTDPLAGTFANAPEEYLRVTARTGDQLTLAGTPVLAGGSRIEVGDDGVQRALAQLSLPVVTLTSVPADFVVPGSLTAFAPGASVLEDYTLPGGSPAFGQGLQLAAGPASDAGIFGSPQAGVPGQPAQVAAGVLRPLGTTPAAVALVGPSESIQIDFSKTLASGSVNASTVRAARTPGGSALGITFFTSGARLTVNAPGGGWGNQDFVIELHRGITAQDGTPLTSPLVLPFRR